MCRQEIRSQMLIRPWQNLEKEVGRREVPLIIIRGKTKTWREMWDIRCVLSRPRIVLKWYSSSSWLLCCRHGGDNRLMAEYMEHGGPLIRASFIFLHFLHSSIALITAFSAFFLIGNCSLHSQHRGGDQASVFWSSACEDGKCGNGGKLGGYPWTQRTQRT